MTVIVRQRVAAGIAAVVTLSRVREIEVTYIQHVNVMNKVAIIVVVTLSAATTNLRSQPRISNAKLHD